MNEINETVDYEYGTIQRRGVPVFLKTIAILTFTGSFLSIIAGFVSFSLIYVAATWRPPSAGAASFVFGEQDEFIRWTMIYCLLLIVTSVICSVGAIVMLKLKAAGFWIYAAGQAIHFTALIVLLFITFLVGPAALSAILVFHFLVCAGFVVMYALNYRYLQSTRTRSEVG